MLQSFPLHRGIQVTLIAGCTPILSYIWIQESLGSKGCQPQGSAPTNQLRCIFGWFTGNCATGFFCSAPAPSCSHAVIECIENSLRLLCLHKHGLVDWLVHPCLECCLSLMCIVSVMTPVLMCNTFFICCYWYGSFKHPFNYRYRPGSCMHYFGILLFSYGSSVQPHFTLDLAPLSAGALLVDPIMAPLHTVLNSLFKCQV